MASSMLNIVNNIFKGIHKTERKSGHDGKKYETCEVIYKDCEWFLEDKNVDLTVN